MNFKLRKRSFFNYHQEVKRLAKKEEKRNLFVISHSEQLEAVISRIIENDILWENVYSSELWSMADNSLDVQSNCR